MSWPQIDSFCAVATHFLFFFFLQTLRQKVTSKLTQALQMETNWPRKSETICATPVRQTATLRVRSSGCTNLTLRVPGTGWWISRRFLLAQDWWSQGLEENFAREGSFSTSLFLFLCLCLFLYLSLSLSLFLLGCQKSCFAGFFCFF